MFSFKDKKRNCDKVQYGDKRERCSEITDLVQQAEREFKKMVQNCCFERLKVLDLLFTLRH